MKKFTKILGSIGSVLVLLLVIGAYFGAFDDEVADLTDGAMADNTRIMGETEDGRLVEVKTNVEGAEEEPESEEKEEIADTTQSTEDHVYVGDVLNYTTYLLTVESAGIVNGYGGEPIIVIEMEIQSTSDEETGVFFDNFTVYIDDYQTDVNVGYRNAEDLNLDAYMTVNPGRKAKYAYRATLPSNYDSASKIEVEFYDGAGSLLIKDNGVYLNGIRPEDYVDNSLDESLYGDHANMDGNGIVLSLEPSDNNEVSALVIFKTNSDANGYLLFMEDDTNGYLTLLSGLSKVGSVCFGEDGIEVNLDNAIRYSGLYAYNQQDMSSAEMDIPREYDSEGILGRYTQVGNPSILLFVEEFDGIIFTVDSGDDIISAGMGSDGLLYIGTDFDADIAGNFTIDGDSIILTNMINPEFNGTYQK